MKWFKKWLFRTVKEGSDIHSKEQAANRQEKYPDESQPINYGNTIAGGRVSRFEQRGLNFTVYKANGGHVVECNQYDPATDRHQNRLHIVTSDQDMGQQLSHIITFEALQR